jgi:K+-sensing histidine kinase KdpD
MAAVDMSIETATDPAFCEHLERENILLKQIQRQIEFTRDYESLGAGAPVWHDVEAVVNKVAKQVLPPSVTIETGMKGVLIFADPLFEKVIYNLMDNAVRHGKTATRIRFFTREDTAGLTLVCEDNGEGVAADEKDRIFFRGYGKNTGLGLFLVREILGITGFGITETGTFMNGARFEIRVPYGMYRL